ncbi:hypothetical protein AL035_21175 [Salipiger aestuarii]|nr:hypothetical protein AL035_21175 [Salipiger aestuarii]
MADNLMTATGASERIFVFANALVGHMRAGLAQVDILSSMIFAGISDVAGVLQRPVRRWLPNSPSQ